MRKIFKIREVKVATKHVSQVRRSRSAFTLLEVMVSSLITAILVSALIMILNSTAKNWTNATATQDSFREARIAMQIIREDLQGVFSETIGEDRWSPLYIRGGSANPLPSPASSGKGGTPTGAYGSSYATFFTRLPQGKLPFLDVNSDRVNDNVGDFSLIGYYVDVYDDSALLNYTSITGSRYVQKLYRYCLGSMFSLKLLQDYNNGTMDYSVYSNFQKTYSIFKHFGDIQSLNVSGNQVVPSRTIDFTKTTGGGNSRFDFYNEPLAYNVVQFELIPYDYNGSIALRSLAPVANGWPDITKIRNTNGEKKMFNFEKNAKIITEKKISKKQAEYDKDYVATLPVYVDIILRVASDDAAKRLSAMAAANTGNAGAIWRGEDAQSQNFLTAGTPLDYNDDREVRTFRSRIYLRKNTGN